MGHTRTHAITATTCSPDIAGGGGEHPAVPQPRFHATARLIFRGMAVNDQPIRVYVDTCVLSAVANRELPPLEQTAMNTIAGLVRSSVVTLFSSPVALEEMSRVPTLPITSSSMTLSVRSRQTCRGRNSTRQPR